MPHPRDLIRRARFASLLAACALLGHAGPAQGDDAGARGSLLTAPAVAPPLDPKELEAKLARLADPRVEVRRAAAREIGALGDEATPAVIAALDRRKDVADDPLAEALEKARHGGDGGVALLEGCVALAPSAPGVRDATAYAALFAALVHASSVTAGRELLAMTRVHGGALARDASHALAELGDPALPALVEAAHDPAKSVSKWATDLLEGMGKRTAADAVQTRRIDVLEAVLATYAKVHDEGAVPAVLSFVTSDKPKVRDAARAAILAYGRTAVPRLREEFLNLTGRAVPPEWDDARLARELFLAYDRASLTEVYALLDGALAKAKSAGSDEAALADATSTFDKVLAREPDLDRRADMVPGYVQYAQILESKDPARARGIFERALRLDPQGHRAAQIESELSYLDAKELASRGLSARSGFARAAELDPGNTKARDELSRIDAAKDAASERSRTWGLSAAALGVALALAILFVGRRRA